MHNSDRPSLSATAVAPLAEIIQHGEDHAVVASSLEAVAVMDLDSAGWRAIFEAFMARFDHGLTPEVAMAAAALPIEEVREALRSLDAGDGEVAAAARTGLIEHRDPATVIDHSAMLQDNNYWEPLAELAADELAEVTLRRMSYSAEAEPWVSITFAKTGDLGPMRVLLDAIAADDGPQLFWGDPEYVATLLRVCQPLPADVELMLRNELDTIDDPFSEQSRSLRILLASLFTQGAVQDLEVDT